MPAENICRFEITSNENKYSVLFNGDVMRNFKKESGKSLLLIPDWIDDDDSIFLALKLSLLAVDKNLNTESIISKMSLFEINQFQADVVVMGAKIDIEQQKKTNGILSDQSRTRMQASGQTEMIAELVKALNLSITPTSSESALIPESE